MLHLQQRHLQALLADEDSWGQALKPAQPLPVPAHLVSALAQLDLPPQWLTVDLAILGEVGAYHWPATLTAQWQAELERLLNHPQFRTWLTALLEVLAEADQLSLAEVQARVTQVQALMKDVEHPTQVRDIHTVFRATLGQLRSTAALTPG